MWGANERLGSCTPWCYTVSGEFGACYTSERSHHWRCHRDVKRATSPSCEGYSSTKSTNSRNPENTFVSTPCTKNMKSLDRMINTQNSVMKAVKAVTATPKWIQNIRM